MNIEYKNTNNVSFKSLVRGDFFKFKGKLYLKISMYDQETNAFNCVDDKLTFFTLDSSVKPINIVLQEV